MASAVPRANGSFYVTTGSTYLDEPPHIGNVGAAVLADGVARWHKMHGKQVVFQTGVHEHHRQLLSTSNQEIASTQPPYEYHISHLACTHERLSIANTDSIGVSTHDHKKAVEDVLQKCRTNEDIYLGDFTGWYNTYEDCFYDDVEARNLGFIDHFTAEPLIRLEQPCYYFRLSKYYDRIVELIEHTNFLRPESFREQLLIRLKKYPLHDLPISRSDSRTGFQYDTESQHVIHSRFSALARYLVAGRADVHIIAEHEVWYHVVVWPALLMSAGLPSVGTVWVHGSILGTDHQQMSGLMGNAVSPHDILDAVPADTLRWYLFRSCDNPLFFNTSVMKSLHDSELRLLGNLMHRAMVLSAKYCQSCVPDVPVAGPFPFNVSEVKGLMENALQNCEVTSATNALVVATQATEDWLTALVAEGRLSKMEHDARQSVIRIMLEAVFVLAHLYAAFTPTVADAIVSKYSTPVCSLSALSSFDNLLPGSAVTSKSVLFKPLEASSNIREDPKSEEDDVKGDTMHTKLSRLNLYDLETQASGAGLPAGLELYLSNEWSPGVLVRPASEETLGDNQMVDERFEYNPLLSRIRSGEHCLDIGGHIGTLAIAMAEAAAGVHVVSVEPDPDSAALLEANLRWRKLSHVTLLYGALRARASASTILYRAPLNASVNSCVPVQGRDAIHVPVVTVADLLHACASPPTILKMDIEGGEYEVLSLVLAACPELRLLSLELHFTKKVFKTHLAPALVELLELFGFRPLAKQRPARQGAAALTFWIREASYPRIDPVLVPPLLALWRHTHDVCIGNLAKRAGIDS